MAIIDMDKMGEALNTKADIDLNNTGVFSTSEGGVVNLTSSTPANASGKEVTSADFFQSNLLNYTTNRILEIPQDIKLELNNGTLTLKAGSKLYDGLGGEHIVPSDMSFSSAAGSATNQLMLIKTDFSTALFSAFDDANLSYNSTTGLAEYTGMGSYYLPVGITTHSGSTYTGIDKIFNGFGYIGSTVFALPGVKVQTPNGKNEDGTYKSVIRTIDSVRTFDAGAWGTRNLKLIVSGGGTFHTQPEERFTYNKQFSSDTHTLSYDENTGLWWYSSNQSSWVIDFVNILGSLRVESGKITSFEPYTVDSILNSSLSNLSAAGEAKLKSNIRLVNELPANPEPGVLYCIPEA